MLYVLSWYTTSCTNWWCTYLYVRTCTSMSCYIFYFHTQGPRVHKISNLISIDFHGFSFFRVNRGEIDQRTLQLFIEKQKKVGENKSKTWGRDLQYEYSVYRREKKEKKKIRGKVRESEWEKNGSAVSVKFKCQSLSISFLKFVLFLKSLRWLDWIELNLLTDLQQLNLWMVMTVTSNEMVTTVQFKTWLPQKKTEEMSSECLITDSIHWSDLIVVAPTAQ